MNCSRKRAGEGRIFKQRACNMARSCGEFCCFTHPETFPQLSPISFRIFSDPVSSTPLPIHRKVTKTYAPEIVIIEKKEISRNVPQTCSTFFMWRTLHFLPFYSTSFSHLLLNLLGISFFHINIIYFFTFFLANKISPSPSKFSSVKLFISPSVSLPLLSKEVTSLGNWFKIYSFVKSKINKTEEGEKWLFCAFAWRAPSVS